LYADGTIRVLVGRLSVSDSRTTNTAEPARMLFTDVSGSITCYVSTCVLFTNIFTSHTIQLYLCICVTSSYVVAA